MFEVFSERANHLSAARRLIAEDTRYASALALLAIHSAISWNDAVVSRLAGKAVRTEDHQRAAGNLERHCTARKLNIDGVKHLRKLLREKSKVSYGDQRTTSDEARVLSITAERFEVWAIRILERPI